MYQYLTGRGIAANRVEYVDYGHTRPIHDKEADELHGRANIRVEVRLLKR